MFFVLSLSSHALCGGQNWFTDLILEAEFLPESAFGRKTCLYFHLSQPT